MKVILLIAICIGIFAAGIKLADMQANGQARGIAMELVKTEHLYKYGY